ncbi:ABC transporter substrate-binding protein [Streptomyces malaysiensis]|uniref:ABC transporter substrate-binding protein n=1 Tax=Streptomyces malaysiensis TaxID=92644 RepID=UPI002B28EA88|nr:ABC transporter substrate-binding protein [Streptomyces malaysiensis]
MAALALVSLLVAACSANAGSGTSGPGGDPVIGGTLNVGVTSDISSLNPYDGTGESTSMVVAQLNAGLFKRYKNKVVPAIAEGLKPSADGKSVTITLRAGLKFSDGKPITPNDVVFSIEQAKQGGVVGSLYKETITSEKAKGADQVVLRLVRPTINLDELLSYTEAAIIPADFGGRSKDEFYRKPVGAGPFALDSRKPGTSVALSRNKNFWEGKKPYFDALNFQVFNSVNALTSAFQGGTVQAVPFAPRESVPSFAGANIVNTAAASTELVFVNGRTGPLKNLKVRKAISAAIDRKAIVKQLGGAADRPTDTYLPSTVLGEAHPVPVKDRDVARAKQLLADTPYGGGVSIELIYPTGDATLAMTVQAIQENLASAGIKLNAKALDLSAWVERLLSGKYELAYQSISATGSTAESTLAFYVTSGGIGGGWSTQVAKTSLQQYQAATDAAAQAKALDKFQAWVSAELPVIPTVSVSPALVLSKKVGGFEGMRSVTLKALPLGELWLTK